MASLSGYMVGVAQLVEHGIVTPVVEGSIPFVHPIFREAPDLTVWRLFCFSGSSIQRLQFRVAGVGCFVVFMFPDDAAPPAGLARKVGCQGDDWQLLLYIEGLAQSPGLIGCICEQGEAQPFVPRL